MMYVLEALRVLAAHKTRSILTMLGLTIGVMAVIAIQVMGSSMSGAINGVLGNLSDDSFIIAASQQQADAQKALVRLSDIKALAALANVKLAVPMTGATDLISHGHNQARYFISGDPVEPFNNAPIMTGHRFTQGEIDAAADVAVISNKAYEKLFPNGEPAVGQTIYAGDHRYQIVGVLAKPKQGLIPVSLGGDVSIPYTTELRDYNPGNRVGAARVIVDDPSQMKATEVAAIGALRSAHGDQSLEYNTFDKAQFTSSVSKIFGVMTAVVAVIGAVSLLVAGVGIMNVLLVSVTERTREIGVRKAIGASRAQILAQFFIEAFLLCGIGCGLGLILGLGIGSAVNDLLIVKLTGYTAPVPWVQAAVITIVFTAVVTLAFGTFPALRAAMLDPIEALRY